MLDPETYFNETEFADNLEPRCACVLVLDTSGSMKGLPIQKLNEGYKLFINTLKKDNLSSLRIELCVLACGGGVKLVQDFTTVDRVSVKPFLSDGDTPMGEAITTAVAKVTERKKVYRTNGIQYYRPWVFMITDGEPTDEWKRAVTLIHEQEKGRHLSFFAVGVEGANMHILNQISVRKVVQLRGLNFAGMFEWLSGSLSAVAESKPDEATPIRSVDGWATAPA